MTLPPLTVRRWKRIEYQRLVDLGAFHGNPVESSPEPDLVVVPGARADYRGALPTRPVLAIEVAEWSLAFDRLNRDPGVDASAPHGWRYRWLETSTPPAVIVPLALPTVRIAVSVLVP
jgi:hypothetical protein